MLPVNHPNKDARPSEEGEEGRPMIKENAHQPHTTSTQSETRVSHTYGKDSCWIVTIRPGFQS